MHVTTVSWHPIPFSLCCFAVLRVLVLRGTENLKKSSAGVTATESFIERCCLGVPVADTSYQLPTAKAPGQPAATA
ncbi:hypothetical protein T08_881 [Trichinella sp. T8]|nr:hypothetical protein T08_881 [Trichinella sp. T8]